MTEVSIGVLRGYFYTFIVGTFTWDAPSTPPLRSTVYHSHRVGVGITVAGFLLTQYNHEGPRKKVSSTTLLFCGGGG